MKANKKKIRNSAAPQAAQTIKIDLHRLVAAQMPRHGPVKVTREMLEGYVITKRPTIRVDYGPLISSHPCKVSHARKRLAVAACMVLMSIALLIPFQIYATGGRPMPNDGPAVLRMTKSAVMGAMPGNDTIKIIRAQEERPHMALSCMAAANPVTMGASQLASVEEPTGEGPVPVEEPVTEESVTPVIMETVTEEPVETMTEPVKTAEELTMETVAEESVQEPAAMEAMAEEPAADAVTDDEWVSLGSDWVITYYCPLSCCNGSHAWCTSTGAPMQVGRTVAVDPSVISYYSQVRIGDMGHEYVAEDCGGAIKGKKIDILVENCSVARQLGINKNVEVWVKR